jgi:hypothetical protein
LSERRRVRLGGVGFEFGLGFVVVVLFVAVVSSLPAVVADDGEDEEDVVPMRKRNVCGIMA